MDSEAARGYIRGDWPPPMQARWNAHLLSCPVCRALVERERSWQGMLGLAPTPATVPGGAQRLLARLVRDARRSRWRSLLPALVMAAVLGSVIGLAIRLAIAPPVTGSTTPLDAAEAEVAAHLDVLVTLGNDPWLADDFDTVRWLAECIRRDEADTP